MYKGKISGLQVLGKAQSTKLKTDGTKSSTSALLTGLLNKPEQPKIYLAAEQGKDNSQGQEVVKKRIGTYETHQKELLNVQREIWIWTLQW